MGGVTLTPPPLRGIGLNITKKRKFHFNLSTLENDDLFVVEP